MSRAQRRRGRPRIHRRTKPGAEPGALKVSASAPAPIISVVAYDATRIIEQHIGSVGELSQFVGKYAVTWINVDGLGDSEVLKQLGHMFQLHPLALEDVVNVHQRAKVDPYESQLFLVARTVEFNGQLETEQISMFLGKDYVITFQERSGDCFDSVRKRIRKASGRLRQSGPDYLAYSLLDAIIDSCFPIVEQFADKLDQIEESVASGMADDVTNQIHAVRNELLLVRRSVRPHREALNELIRDDHPLISDTTRVFLRDCYDHTIQLIDLLEVYRDMCSDLRDYYLTLASNRMNEVMKVLTIIATIFMPLSFIAGVYGMNFNTEQAWNMPELNWAYGYPFAISLMVSVAVSMLIFFRRRNWIGPRPRTRS